MQTEIHIFDELFQMLEKIATLNYGLALDALDHAGAVVRDSKRREFRKQYTQWTQVYVDGKRQIRKNDGMSQVLGIRISHERKGRFDNAKNMSNFITSYMMEKNMLVVVGGKHKSFRAKRRRDGKVVGFESRVGATTKSSYAILQKLNDGKLTNDYKTLVRKKSIKSFENANYRNRGFAKKGERNALPRVREIMTSTLESMIHRQINRTEVKANKVTA